MQTQVTEIKFASMGKEGIIEIVFSENTGPVTSGFEIVKDLIPDLNICLGYPTISAIIKEFSGFGFTKYCGWIQVITIELYNNIDSTIPNESLCFVDVTQSMQKSGIPFFAYGYPATLYDAPVNNYVNLPRVVWKANTFLVAMPSYINNDSISYLAGFEWGYIETVKTEGKQIEILPLKTRDNSAWEQYLELFRKDFHNWNFN